MSHIQGTDRKTCVLIAGMHRSGTSAIARVINLIGADIAKELLPAIPGVNDRGFWESSVLHKVHDDLLRELGSSWDDPFPFSERWLENDATKKAEILITEHLNNDFSGSSFFVIKDPRLSILLPLWLKLLDQLDIKPIVVIPFRNPLEVAASLKQRDQMSVAKALLCYVRSNLEIELASRSRTRVFYAYKELPSNWRTLLDKLKVIDGFDTKNVTQEAIRQIEDFLSKDLYHHRFDRSCSHANTPDGAAIAIEIYDRMIEVAATGNDSLLRGAFDRLRGTIEETGRLYREIVLTEAGMHQREIERLEQNSQNYSARIETLEDELHRRDADIGAMRVRVKELDAKIEILTILGHRRETEIQQITEELERNSAANHDLKEAQLKVHHAYTKILNSTSWRITAPLRALRRVAKL